jgi:hypothetical protein
VDDLREEIERLKKENCRLMDKVLEHGKRDESGGGRKKKVIKEMEVEVVEDESHEDGNTDTGEE